jgi:hypothetical protein
MPNIITRVDEATDTQTATIQPLPDDWAHVRARPEWRQTWCGGTDPMHLIDHALTPVLDHVAPAARLVVGAAPTTTSPGHAVLLLEGYLGWYRTLHVRGTDLPTTPGCRSWHVDVVCKPLGWLGTYRRSWVTGRWFAGRHRWHEFGVPEFWRASDRG